MNSNSCKNHAFRYITKKIKPLSGLLFKINNASVLVSKPSPEAFEPNGPVPIHLRDWAAMPSAPQQIHKGHRVVPIPRLSIHVLGLGLLSVHNEAPLALPYHYLSVVRASAITNKILLMFCIAFFNIQN